MPKKGKAAKKVVTPSESEDEEVEASPAKVEVEPAPAKEAPKAAPVANDDDSAGSESEESGDEAKPKKPEAPAEPAPAKIVIPASVHPYYRSVLEGAPFKSHTESGHITDAANVFYCDVCGLPPDFCQYGPTWEKCKPWVIQNAPFLHPELVGASLEDAKKGAAAVAEKAKTKELPGGKKVKEKEPGVTIKKLTRGGRKCVTTVTGLESFGVNLADAAKNFKKKFACGSAVVKGDNGLPDFVEIQGDFEIEVVDLICEKHPEVDRKKITYVEGGTKKGGKK